MKAYTYQIGQGADGVMAEPKHAESLYADSLGEAIDKAKAITNLRPPHVDETIVSIVENAADAYALWSKPVSEVRES